jgi:hypothetical protein
MSKKISFRLYDFGDGKLLKLFGYTVWSNYKGKGQWWFKLFGMGLVGKDTKIYDLSFSQRNGYRNAVIIHGWYIYRLRNFA